MCCFFPMCPYVWLTATSSALSLHSQTLMHSPCYCGALKAGTAQVRVNVWRYLTLRPHEEDSLVWCCHSCPPYLTCPRGVRRGGTSLTSGANPSWSSTHNSTPAEELVLEGCQPCHRPTLGTVYFQCSILPLATVPASSHAPPHPRGWSFLSSSITSSKVEPFRSVLAMAVHIPLGP